MNYFTVTRQFPLTTREGLEGLYQERISKPEPIAPKQYRRLSEERRAIEDQRRLLFIHRGLTIGTPTFVEAVKQLGSLFVQNQQTVHDKLSLGLSGVPYLGKSHLLFELARYTSNRLRRDVPDFLELGIVPCVIITLSPTNSKGILQELMNFFGYPFNQGYTEGKLRSIVVNAMNEHGTVLLGFDEAHNMARGTRVMEDNKNMLRKLMQDLSATQVYSGIELRANGLFAGISGSQLSRRIRMIDLYPYTAASQDSRELWMRTLDQFEEGLCLIGNEPGTLRSLAPYLYNRTGGVMGELANVLRTAASSLIRDGVVLRYGREQLTQSLLEMVPPGDAAEQRLLHMEDGDERDWPTWPLQLEGADA